MTETIRVALLGLAANKLRSGLTILGLMIGVGLVIVLIAVGTGSSSAVQQQIDALGSNVLEVTSTGALGGFAAASTGTNSLTVADAAALKNPFTAPDVASSAPVVNAAAAAECGGAGASAGADPARRRIRASLESHGDCEPGDFRVGAHGDELAGVQAGDRRRRWIVRP